MNKIFVLFLFCRLLLITTSIYVGESSLRLSEKNSYYVITAPKVWTSSEESVCLVLLKQFSLPNAVINVKISSINGREIFTQKYQSLNSYSQCIQIPTSQIRAEKALLNIVLNGIFDDTFEIRVKPSNGLTLIETSKPIYRTNERLEFRIIRVNDWLRPIEEQFDSVSIENSKSIVVMQWRDVKTRNGILALDMPIAVDNYYGVWTIKVVNNKNMVTEKIFKVYDYETPNVIISVDSPNYLNFNDKQSVSKVCVTNALGQPLKGSMKTLVGYDRFKWDRISLLNDITTPYDFREFEIQGCYNLNLRADKLYWNSSSNFQTQDNNLFMNFQFTDKNSGFIEEKSLRIPVVKQHLFISFPSIRLIKQYFKPGLPYFGYALITNPDYSPLSGHKLKVCYESRLTPWTSVKQDFCQTLVSNSDGLVEFTIPPFNNHIKQIEVKVHSIEYPSIENKLFLQPSYSPSNDYITIKPIINKNYCNKSMVEFEVFAKNQMPKQIYYQVISRSLPHSPQLYNFESSEQWLAQNMDPTYDSNNPILKSTMKVQIPIQSAMNNNLMNRILVYYLDSDNSLIADSNVFLTTCSDPSFHSTRIDFEDTANDKTINLKLRAQTDSTCAMRVTQNKPYNKLKEINQFIEKFDVIQEYRVQDKCQKGYNERTITETNGSPYSVPYDLESTAFQTYDPVINYGDSWDSFNDIGLIVSSNAKLDESPCDWELYPRDILSQLSEIRNSQRKYLSSNKPLNQIRDIKDIERSLFNEVFEWNLVNTHSNTTIDKQIKREFLLNSGQLYADTVCLNKKSGITYARNVFDNKYIKNDKKFWISVESPKESRIGDTLPIKVFIQKTIVGDQNCYPIELEFKSSDSYEIVNRPKIMCFCGHNGSEPIQMWLRPKTIGLLNVRVVAKYPIDMTSDIISSDCTHSLQSTKFSPQVVIKQITVNPMGIVSKHVQQRIVCNNNNNNNIVENVYEENKETPQIQDLSYMNRDGSDMIVTNELLEPMFRYITTRAHSKHHNLLDSLSTFAASYYLYNYTEDIASKEWLNSNQLQEELSKSYQSMETYRHRDGSYSLLKSKKYKSDLSLTVLAFKLLAQSKSYLSFIESGQNRLRQTLIWIFQQQANDGCFHISYQQTKSNMWPISFQDDYQLTGYILASLLESGVDPISEHLTKAYNCLSLNSQSFIENINSKPLSAILFSYIQILNGRKSEAKKWLNTLQTLNNLDGNDLFNGEVLSYLALSHYLSNDSQTAKSLALKLLKSHSSNIWETPISCYAIIKLWPLLKHKTSATVKVYKSNNEIESTLLVNSTHSVRSLKGHKISIESNGCLFVANNKVKTHLANEATNFDIKIDGLNQGFVTCNTRRITLCVKQLAHSAQLYHPVVRMQIITGFDVDNSLMKKMINTEVVAKYRKRGNELYMFLHPFLNKEQSQCFSVPVVRRHGIYGTNKAFIKIYDYYNEDINDVVGYEIPLQCQTIDTNVIQVNA
jgi:hypothetical protein